MSIDTTRLTSVRGRLTITPAMGELGTLLRDKRKELGLSLRAVADVAHVSFVTIRDIERGDIKQPRAETLSSLGVALGIPFRDLALAAYGANGDSPSPNGHTRQTPSESDSSCPPARGRKPGRVSGSIS
jgi:transcriptional regulator with XRE-family HTH domain